MNCRFAVILLLFLAGCATPREHPVAQAPLAALLPADALLVGEQHDAAEHHRLERALVETLAARGQLAALVLEMADAGQSTASLTRGADEADVRTALAWNDAAWPWLSYGPAVMAAVRAGVPVLGANLPMAELRGAMQSVALDGHLTLESWQKQQQNMRDGHCGLLPERQIVPMARVQLARDAAMARTVLDARQRGKTVLLIAGNGHVDRQLGVPTHLGVGVRFSALTLVPVPASGPAGEDRRAADAVWMTPTLPPKDYCAELKAPAAPTR